MATPLVAEHSAILLNFVTVLVLGGMQGVSMWINKRRGEKNEQAVLDNTKHQVINQEINERKMAEIHTLVDGPLGIALDALATALERHARTTLIEADILAALTARKASAEHNQRQSAALDMRRTIESNKARAVAEFLAAAKAGQVTPVPVHMENANTQLP